MLEDIDIPGDGYELPVDLINVSGKTILDLSLLLDEPGPSNKLPSSSQPHLPSDEEADFDNYDIPTCPTTASPGEDNDYATGSVNNPPPFLGQHTINVSEENPFEFLRTFSHRGVIKSLHDSSYSAQNKGEHLDIDEKMIPFKGRHRAKHLKKNKPEKWGFKMWVRESRNVYVQCFELYGGKKSSVTALGPVSNMIVRLCHNIKEKNYKENKIYAIGKVRIKSFKDSTCNLVSGSSSIVTSFDNITIVRWKDN